MKLMTCREASVALREKYGVTQTQIKRRCLTDRCPSIKIGNRLLVDVDALRTLLDEERQREQLMGTTDLARHIGLSESTIRRAAADGWLPYHKEGRNMRFVLSEVQQAIQDRMSNRYNS